MPCCDTGRNIQKYKGAAASTLQDVTDNGNTTTGDIITTSGYFIGDGSKLTGISGASAAFTLQETSDRGNTTSNVVQFTNTITSLTTSGNVIVAGNVTASNFYGDGTTLDGVALKTDLTSNVGRIGVLESKTTAISYTNSTTTISSNLEINGNLSITGNTYTINSDTLVIEDRIIGIANNNTSHTLDVGIVMQHPDHNIAIIHHGSTTGTDPHEHVLTIGYTQNTVTDDHITDDTSNIITVEVLGNLIVQNNLTISEGSIYGTINGSNTITTSGVYGPIKGSNTITAGTISTATGFYGPIKGSNTISGTTLNVDSLISDDASAINKLNASNVTTGTLSVDYGGTNITTYAKGDILIASATDTLSNLSLGTGGYVLTSNSTSGLPEWKSSSDLGTQVAQLSNGSYILGGSYNGINPEEWSVQASTSNTADYIVARDSSGDIFVSNVNAINIRGDGSGITNSNASNISLGTLAVARGGTGFTSYAIGDILYASSPSALSKLAPSTAGYFLKTNGTGNAPTWENVADIGSATPANLYTDDYITGGPWSGLTDANIRVLGNVSNLSNQLVARDNKGDIFVSNVNAIQYYGDGGTLSNISGSQDLHDVITIDPYTNSPPYFGAGSYGAIYGSNTINASTISTTIGFYGPIKGSNTITTSGVYGPIYGSNTINAGTISTATGFYGPINGSNTISGTTLNVDSLISDDASAINKLNASNVTTGTLSVDYGGTNITTYAKGDILIASATDTLSNLSLGTGGYVLTSNSTSGLPEWKSSSDLGTQVAQLSNGSYILGGSYNGINPEEWSVQASTSNTADYIVARDSSGDIFVSNVNAIQYYGDGGTLSNISGSQDLHDVITIDPYTNSPPYFGAGSYGAIYGSNTINASTISTTVGFYGPIKGSNTITTSGVYGPIYGSNTINAGTISTATGFYGPINGSNTISGTTLNVDSLISDDASAINKLNASNVTTGTLSVDYGGTNITTYAKGDILIASATDTLSNLSLGTGGYVLTSNSTSGLPEWKSSSDLGTQVAQLSNGSYILGGSYNGINPEEWSVQASTSNTADYIVARDSSGDIFVSNVNAIQY